MRYIRVQLARRVRASRGDAGMTTAEYAVGTVAAAGLGGILIKLLTSGDVRDLIWTVLSNAFKAIFGLS